MSLFEELKRRNVFRVAVAYLITSWLLLQVADVVLGNIGAPAWVFKTILLVLVLGFPLALLFAWAFELTPEGIKKEKDVDRTQSITPHTGRKLDYTIIALLAVALVYFIWESRFDTTGNVIPAENSDIPTGSSVIPAENSDIPTGSSVIPAKAGIHETPAEASSEAATDKSIAVLPFTTRSTDENDKFFSDGMHDDLLTQLAKIGELKVISRTSVMEYRDTTKNLRQIGNELGVAAILEGAIQRSGNQVRINVQLIDARTDEHVWAEIYDRELTAENLFAVQTEIAKAIAAALHATLSPAEQQRIEQNQLTDNLEALQAYQRARLLQMEANEENLLRAESETDRALALDPGFAAAWALKAQINMAFHWWAMESDERVATARESIKKGRAIDPALPELDIAEGYYYYWGFRDYLNAVRVLEPVALAYPNNADVRKVLAFVYRRQGRYDEALQQLHKALELEPRSIEIAVSLSETYQNLQNFDEARNYLALAEAINPISLRYYSQAAYFTYAVDGDPAAALRNWEHDPATYRYEVWRAQAVLGTLDPTQDFEIFRDAFALGYVKFLPDLIHGLTLWLAGDPGAAQPFLNQAVASYQEMLEANPTDFRLLKPLCMARGALQAKDAALQACKLALDNLPDDAWDRNFHREDIAGGLAMAGLNDEALDLLEILVAEPVRPTPVELQLDPLLKSLHNEPRWQALMAEPAL